MKNLYKIKNELYIIDNEEILPYNSDIFQTGAFYHKDAAGDVHIINKDTHYPNPNFCSRIILTTDKSLFKYGVQTIDDDFLNWFTNNPNCQEVEIDYQTTGLKNGIWQYHYKIIIPQQNPKQETLEEALSHYIKDMKEVPSLKLGLEIIKRNKQTNNVDIENNVLYINNNILFDYNNFTPITGTKVQPYTYPDMNEDLLYMSTYIKGKSKNINDIRLLMVGVKSNKKYFMFLKEDFNGGFLHFIDLTQFKEINKQHYKFKSYNYYSFREDINDVNILLNEWLINNPIPFQYSTYKINDINNYTYLFNYNGNKY
jgi:hypothetical protein